MRAFCEIRREPEGADTAVLLLHGILSAPHFLSFIADAVPAEYAVYGILFAGHGSTPDALGSVTLDVWRRQVADRMQMLCRCYRRVLIAAHSMGTLFAVEAAADYPETVQRMVLLNVPLYPHLTMRCAAVSLGIACGLDVHGVSTRAAAMQDAYSISPDPRLWRYLCWLPRYHELFAEMRRVRSMLQSVQTPAAVFQSAHDELVSPRSLPLLKAHPRLHTVLLRDSTHFAYAEADRRRILRAVRQMLQ